jgi:hypothetical protein
MKVKLNKSAPLSNVQLFRNQISLKRVEWVGDGNNQITFIDEREVC